MIRDRLVVGVRDASLSLKLQLDPNLTLKTAVTQQQVKIRWWETTIHCKASRSASKHWLCHFQETAKTCTRCGRSPPHSRHGCPVREAICHKCFKKGHYFIVCCTAGSIQRVQSSPMMEDTDEFLGAIETESSNRSWTVPLLLNDVSVDFKIDTGQTWQ